MVIDIFRYFNLIEYVYENLLYFTYMNYNNPDLRILNITHSDMDGIACSIVLKNFYKTVHVLPTNYNTEWKLADDAKAYEGKYDIIICTDFCPTKAYADICKLGHVLVIDHHESVMDRNNNETIVINTQWSATALVYKFISKFKNISYLDNFVKLVDDWDMFRLKDPRSPFFNNMFWEMVISGSSVDSLKEIWNFIQKKSNTLLILVMNLRKCMKPSKSLTLPSTAYFSKQIDLCMTVSNL